MSDMSDISATRIKSTKKSTTVGCLHLPKNVFRLESPEKKVTSSPGIEKNQLSGSSVRPANGMSSVLNIQSVFVFSIHPRGQTNILPSGRVSYHIQTLKLGLFCDRRRRVGGGGEASRKPPQKPLKTAHATVTKIT